MTQPGATLVKITAQTAAELCVAFDLDDAAQQLLQPGDTPEQFLDALSNAGLVRDAAQFLAYALPQREACWWSCLVARSTLTEATPAPAVEALQAAEAWAYQPTEENRRAAEAAAQVDGALDHPGGWAAQAAFWATGSMSPEGNPPVPPDPFFTAKAVSAVLLIAAASGPPPEELQRFAAYLAWGRDIAAGGTGSGGA